MRPYVIRQGDFLTRLAYMRGFDAVEVWAHDKNQALRDRRSSPDILYPGDIIYLPVARTTGLTIKAGSSNRYTAVVPRVDVTLQFYDDGKPVANDSCEVFGLSSAEAEAQRFTTDEQGALSLVLPVTTAELEVYFASHHTSYFVKLGHLDPVDETMGQAKRLQNLNYVLSEGTVGDAELGAAVTAFSREHQVEPDSDKKLQDKLVDQHAS